MSAKLGYLTLHIVALALLLSLGHARACYFCASDAKETVLINNEWAVILWDPETHVEQLIWMIDFRTDARSFTLLVPTPTVPDLTVVDPAIFRLARDSAMPKLVPPRVHGDVLHAALISYVGLASLIRKDSGITYRRVAEEHVAIPTSARPDFTATLLDASDPVQVPNWLKANGFGWKDGYSEWLARYSLKNWHISAFKFTTSLNELVNYRTAALKFTFKTDQPFFPYREFEDSEGRKPVVEGGRALALTYLSDAPVTGCLEEGMAWPAVCKFMGNGMPEPKTAFGWTDEDWLKLTKLEGRVTEPIAVSHFIDESNPRPGNTDLFFSPAPNLEPFRAEQTDFSERPVHYFQLRDYLSIPVAFILPCLFIYIAVRSWQKAGLIEGVSSSDSLSKIHRWLQNADSILALITAIVGFLFMASFAIIPAFFLAEAVALVNRRQGNATIFAHLSASKGSGPKIWPYRLYSLSLIVGAVVYLVLVIVNVFSSNGEN